LKSKLSRTNSVKNLSAISPQAKYTYCALINSDKKHEYHDVMIKNYLRTAAERFQHSPYVSYNNFINKYTLGQYSDLRAASHFTGGGGIAPE